MNKDLQIAKKTVETEIQALKKLSASFKSSSQFTKAVNLCSKTKNKIVVWELDRPIPDMNEVTSLEDDVSFDKLIEECNYLTTNDTHVNSQLLREKIIFIFEKLLRHEPGTVGVPYSSLLWIFLENENLEIIQKFYNELMKGLKTSNQYAMDHNVVLSYSRNIISDTEVLYIKNILGIFYL